MGSWTIPTYGCRSRIPSFGVNGGKMGFQWAPSGVDIWWYISASKSRDWVKRSHPNFSMGKSFIKDYFWYRPMRDLGSMGPRGELGSENWMKWLLSLLLFNPVRISNRKKCREKILFFKAGNEIRETRWMTLLTQQQRKGHKGSINLLVIFWYTFSVISHKFKHVSFQRIKLRVS